MRAFSAPKVAIVIAPKMAIAIVMVNAVANMGEKVLSAYMIISPFVYIVVG